MTEGARHVFRGNVATEHFGSDNDRCVRWLPHSFEIPHLKALPGAL